MKGMTTLDLSYFKKNGHLLIGSSGAVSVVNLYSWIVFLKQSVCENIQVILTKQASQMINPQMVSQFTGNQTFTDLLSSNHNFKAPHVSLGKWADLFLILPSTANILGKAANGIADDLLSSTIIYAECPTVFIPSMNLNMWNKKVVQNNVNKLKEYGYHIHYQINENYVVASGVMELGLTIDIEKLGIKLSRIINGNKN